MTESQEKTGSEQNSSDIPGRPGFSRSDLVALGILLGMIVLIFLPNLSEWFGQFHDDLAMDEFPRLYSYARSIRQGIMPLWRPEIWCGARPLYSDYYSNLYYLPFWPFMIMAPLGNLDAAFFFLCTGPLFIHYALAALGTYLLARRGFRLRPPAALVSSVLFTFSPGLMFSYVWQGALTIQVWLPWLLLVYLKQVWSPRWLGWAAGTIIIAFMSASGSVPHLGYVIVLLSFVCAGLMIGKAACGYTYPIWRPPMILAAFLAGGILLAAVYWLPAITGIKMIRNSGLVTYEFAAGGEGSLHPLYLVSLLVPGIFGGLNGTHLWGLGQVRFWEANMTGGLAVTLLVLLGLILPWVLPGGKRRVRVLRLMAVTGGTIYLFSLLIMLGRHTFVYRWLWDYLPLAGKMPYPIRYRLLQCLAAAVLGGLGMHLLLRRGEVGEMLRRRIVTGYLIAVLIIIAGILLWPPMKIMEVVEKGDLTWFLTLPILYLVLGVVLISIISCWAAPRRFAYLLAILAILEIGYTAFQAFYFGTFQMGGEIYPQHIRAREPGSHPMYRRALSEVPRYIKDGSLRVASDQPFHDNLQQCGPYFSFMGYDMKPLEPRFQAAIEAAYQHPLEWTFLYGIHKDYPRAAHPSFYSNMSVGYFLSANPNNPFPQGTTVKLESSPDYYLHINQHPLPRAFTMDRIVECSEDEAIEELVRGNLREAVFIDDSNQLSVIGHQGGQTDYRSLITDYHSFIPSPASIKHFKELQSANPIKELDLTNPNRIEVDIAVTKPAMLILTEIWYPGWEAAVDGDPSELYRVNYLQRGVWLNEGEHRVELIFRPKTWRIGMIISVISWGILILVLLGWGIRRLIRRYHPALGSERVSI